MSVTARVLLATAFLLSIASCARHPGCTDVNATNFNVNAQVDNGSCQYVATFYFDQTGPSTTVSINNQSANLPGNVPYQSGPPSCSLSAAGCANFNLPIGTYNFTANNAFGGWSGSVVINGSGCQVIQLPLGQATFWTASNNYGNITVTIGTGTSTITSYITGGTPSCGFTGCATFSLPPATYPYTAAATNGATWSGNVTTTADGCATVQF